MREEAIFHEALQRNDTDRAAYLHRACEGDDALLGRVEVLLKAHAEPNGFLQNAAATLDRFPVQPQQLLGKTIGAYRIREQIGEGGMGVVFAAEQTEPVKRKVALKVIKPCQASHDVIARFEAERQALAVMDHANIARIFDGGTTESGLPYFVMELVQGLPITQYCDRHRLDLADRLELFRSVCDAVHHAHQKGVIHRDLKPSNVLVPQIDGVGVPKVIDFGVAKAVNQKLTDLTLYTQFSQMIGSPLYMSPEQAELGVIDIDTRSDVYALGVLLYELLTGSTPIEPKTLQDVGFDEMRRIIREDDPPTPSFRVSTVNAAQSSTLPSQPAADDRQRVSRLNHEVDWIVMKALEKDRFRRYQSAVELATDIQHYLNNEPVTACPPSASYRIKKYVTRHRARVTLLGVVAIGLLLGLVGLIYSNLAIREQRDRAEALKLQAQSLQVETLQQKEVAEENLDLAKEAVDSFVTRFANELSAYPDTSPLRKRLLNDALAFHSRFVDQGDDTLESRLEAARSAIKVGDIHVFLGEPNESVAAYQKAETILEPLAQDAPAEYLDEMVNVMSKLAGVYHDVGETRESLTDYDTAIGRTRALLASDASNLKLKLILAKQLLVEATSLRRVNEDDDATMLYEEVLALVPAPSQDDLDVDFAAVRSSAHNGLGLLHLDGNPGRAKTHFEASIHISKMLLEHSPGVAERRGLASLLNNVGMCYVALGDFEAEANVRWEALKINRELATQFPNSPIYLARLADSLKDVAAVSHKQGDLVQATRLFLESIEMSRELLGRYPDYLEHRRLLARGLLQYAELLLETSELPKAESTLEESYALWSKSPEIPTARVNMRLAEILLSLVHGKQEAWDHAQRYYDQAIIHKAADLTAVETSYLERAIRLLRDRD